MRVTFGWFARPAIAGLALLAVLTAALELAVASDLVSRFVVPPPSEILLSVPKLFAQEHLAGLFVLTFGITFTATGLAALLGVPIGLFLYRYSDFGRAYESWLGAIFSSPIILLYPLFLVVMGRGVPTIVVMSTLVGVTPIILNTFDGLRRVPEVYVNVARSFNMSKPGIFWKVLLPAALPSIFTGIRLALIYSMINAVAMEFLISIGGLGFLVGDLYDRYYLAEMYGTVLFVILASIMFFSGIDAFEKWLTRR